MSDDKKKSSRRDFLKLAGTTAPAAVAALAMSADEVEAAEPVKASGLRKTDHVKKYLETARF